MVENTHHHLLPLAEIQSSPRLTIIILLSVSLFDIHFYSTMLYQTTSGQVISTYRWCMVSHFDGTFHAALKRRLKIPFIGSVGSGTSSRGSTPIPSGTSCSPSTATPKTAYFARPTRRHYPPGGGGSSPQLAPSRVPPFSFPPPPPSRQRPLEPVPRAQPRSLLASGSDLPGRIDADIRTRRTQSSAI